MIAPTIAQSTSTDVLITMIICGSVLMVTSMCLTFFRWYNTRRFEHEQSRYR